MIDPPDEETLLNQFRAWLQEARAEAEDEAPTPGAEPDGLVAEDGEIGLYRLAEDFTALRHEIKLQTKSARGLQEQAEALVPALRQAIEHFLAVDPGEARAVSASWAASRPLAEALADLDEALDRGRAELEKARQRLVDEPPGAAAAALDDLFARQSWWTRLLARSYQRQARDLVLRHGQEARRALFDALLEGYGLIQARLQRSLEAEQIRRIPSVGRPVAPELMTVVEVVPDPDRPPGQVIEEIRRGYTWRGRVLRYAEVRASREPVPDWSPDSEPEPEHE